jgi:hypothetical protein
VRSKAHFVRILPAGAEALAAALFVERSGKSLHQDQARIFANVEFRFATRIRAKA